MSSKIILSEGKMKKWLCLGILVMSASFVFSQSEYQASFYKLMQAGRIDDAKGMLADWERSNPNDIELAICNFNYYMYMGTVTENTIGKMPDGRYGAYPKTYVKEPQYSIALGYLDKALAIDADRIDVHIGKMQYLDMNQKYSELESCIAAMLSRIDINANKWNFKNGKPLSEYGKNPEQVIINAINNVISVIRYNEDLFDIGYNISIVENKYFPNNVIAINHLASYLLDKGEAQAGIDLLLKAYSIDPTDEVIIINIGLAYSKMNSIDEAIKYFSLIIDSKDKRKSDFARQQIEKLQAKK